MIIGMIGGWVSNLKFIKCGVFGGWGCLYLTLVIVPDEEYYLYKGWDLPSKELLVMYIIIWLPAVLVSLIAFHRLLKIK